MKTAVMSSHGVNSSTISTNQMDINSNKDTTTGSEVRIVTIAGKEVEVKYETMSRKYDIFGLHSKQRRFGNKTRSRDTTHTNTIRKNLADDKQVESMSTSSNNLSISSNTSSGSKETSVGSTKLNKILKRFESADRSPKTDQQMVKITDKLKKEPVKMENRFDKLLPTSGGEELKVFDNYSDSIVKSSAKKRKKKKTKITETLINSNNNYFDGNYSNNSENFDAHEELIAQKVIKVHKTIDSIYDNENNDEVIESNNNNSFSVKENLYQKQNDYKKELFGFNGSFGEGNDNFEKEEEVEELIEEIEVKRNEESVAVRKEEKQKFKTKYPNGLTVKPIGLKDNSVKSYDQELDRNKELRQQVIKESLMNASVWKLITNWLFITLLVVVFLVIYTFIILNQFCDCSNAS
jgi:hypothetical protein